MIPARAPRWPRPGQALALTAPGGALEPEALDEGLAALAELAPDLRLVNGPELGRRAGYFAGRDSERAEHLARLMADPGVGLVMAARGGFGCSRLLPLMDIAALVAADKPLLGCSDLTCMLNALAVRGRVALHGPMLTQLSRLDQPSRADLAALFAGRPAWPATLSGQPLRPGRTRGVLMGGNLTLLCHLLGTPHFPSLAGCILFIEDVGEAAYRLDRMLTQLELSGVLERVAGVAVGSLTNAAADPPALTETVAQRLAELAAPVVMGLPFGHGPKNRLLPVGAVAELDGEAGRLSVGLGLV
ncbi:MAG: LD-carboxypeptidase [Pseudomonadota bacterium]